MSESLQTSKPISTWLASLATEDSDLAWPGHTVLGNTGGTAGGWLLFLWCTTRQTLRHAWPPLHSSLRFIKNYSPARRVTDGDKHKKLHCLCMRVDRPPLTGPALLSLNQSLRNSIGSVWIDMLNWLFFLANRGWIAAADSLSVLRNPDATAPPPPVVADLQ